MKRQAKVRRYSETWLGRRRYLPGIVSDDWGKKSFAERCAMNTPIQGTAADILKLALGRLIVELAGLSVLRPLLQIHDELVFELPADKWREAAALIRLLHGGPALPGNLTCLSWPRPLLGRASGNWQKWRWLDEWLNLYNAERYLDPTAYEALIEH